MNDNDKRATDTIKSYSLYATGAGLIPVPLFDMAAITGLQLKMIHSLSGIYGVEFRTNRVRSIVASLVGGVSGTTLGFGLGHYLVKAVPVVGPVVGGLSVPAMAGAVTWAVGKVFMQHFAAGGTLLDFDPEKMREHFRAEVDAASADAASADADTATAKAG